MNSYDSNNNALSVYDVDGNGLGIDIVVTDFNKVRCALCHWVSNISAAVLMII